VNVERLMPSRSGASQAVGTDSTIASAAHVRIVFTRSCDQRFLSGVA
jgi:hypothetical protein